MEDDAETNDDVMTEDEARAAGYAPAHEADPDVMTPEEARAAGYAPPDNEQEAPQPEGHIMADTREIGHAILPAAAGYAAAGAGAEVGGALGTLAAPFTGALSIPVGAALGAIVGFAGGGLAMSAVQERAAKLFGWDDTPQRQANIKERPLETWAAGMATGAAGMTFGMGVKVWQRLISAGALSTFEGAQEYMTDGKLDPVKLALAATLGAVLPVPNKMGGALIGAGENAGKKIVSAVRGRPGGMATATQPKPPEDMTGFDPTTGESLEAVDAASGPLAESAGPGTGAQAEDHGGSSKLYPKTTPGEQAKYKDALDDPEQMRQFAFDEGLTEDQAREIAQANYNEPNAGVSTGHIQPDVGAALKAAQPEPLPLENPVNQQNLQQQWPLDHPHQPNPTPAPAQPGVPFMITQAMKKRLGVSGFSPEEISRMTPTQANDFLKTNGSVADVKKTRAEFPPPQQGQLGLTPRVQPRRALRVAEEVKEDSKQPGIQQPVDEGEEPDKNLRVNPPGNAAKTKLGLKPAEPIATPPHPLEAGMEAARADIHPTPSDRQIEAENYDKGHPGRFAGHDVSIETAKGGTRRSKPGQPPWEVPDMPTDYGHMLRTVGADGDPIDIHYAGTGDKHFVIDQRDPVSGKFDEHKIMSFAKDEANARDLYAKGFSDNKGPLRIASITEASEDQLRKWAGRLANMPAQRKYPYGHVKPADVAGWKKAAAENAVTATVTKAEPKPSPELITENKTINSPLPTDRQGVLAKDRYAVRDMLAKMRAKGGEDAVKADALEAMPNEQLLKYVKDANLRRRNYGTGDGKGNWPVGDLKNPDGTAVGAKSPALAKERGDAIMKVKEAYNEAALPSQLKPEDEANGELLSRLKKAVDAGEEARKAYKPQYAGNRIEWSWMKEASDLLKKPTEANIAAFRKLEPTLRDPELAKNRLEARRIQADSELGKGRGGDEAVANAEAHNAALDAGRNQTEDSMIDALDAKRNQKIFDTPHEEAEELVKPTPVKSAADLKAPTGKQIDVTKPGGEDAVEKLLQAGKVARQTPLAEKAADTGKKGIKVSAADQAKYAEMLKLAAGRDKSRDKALDITAPPDEPTTPKMRDLFDKFGKDERASFDLNKVIADLKGSAASFSKPHEADTYISKKSNGPADDYARSLDEDLFKDRKKDENTLIQLMQHAARLEEDGIDHALMEKIYHARDKEQAGMSTLAQELTPAELGLYNKFMKPVTDFANARFKVAKSLDADGMIGPEVMSHQSRITKGQSEEYNVLKTGQSSDPIEGRINGIASAAKKTALDRKFFVMENTKTGQRSVVSQNAAGYTVWNKYKGTRVIDPNFNFKAGEKYKVKNTDYDMKQALTTEIEANARMEGGAIAQYYHNSAMSDILDAATMDQLARNMQRVMDIKNSDNFQKYTTTDHEVAQERARTSNSNPGEQWEKLILPGFEKYYAHPDLAAMLNSYAEPGFHGFDGVRGVAQGITKLMFWLPTAHINNVGAHWFVERGWKWVNPVAYRDLVVTGMKSIKSVMTQDALQMKLRSEGAGLMSGGPITKEWYQKIGKALGEHIEANPSKWDPIAKQFGWGPSTLAKAVYDGSSRVMWAADDMFKTQAYLEHMKNGMGMQGSIRTAERHIPNYRLPGKIIGSGSKGRFLQKLLSEPTVISFGRYHYEVFNSFAHITKDIVHGDAKQKFDAIGNIMAMGLLGLGIYPLLDKAARALTGNEHASAHRRGPMAVGSAINSAANADKDPMAAPRAALTVSPLVQAILEARANKDFAGRNIVEPGNVKRAAHGSPTGAAKVATEIADYAGKSLVSPYGSFANAYQTKKQGPLATIRDQALDIRNPGPKAAKFQALSGKKSAQDAMSRYRQGGRGPLEYVVDKILGY